MTKIFFNGLICISLAFFMSSCFNTVSEKKDIDFKPYLEANYWKNQALNDIIPIWEKTADKTNGGFFTDINRDGSIGHERGKYPRMLSRAVYGFTVAYLLSGDDKYLELAENGLEYLTNYGWDEQNGGWYNYIDSNNKPLITSKDLFDETYGNLGPVIFYFATHNKNALSYVEKTHKLMQTKAWDKKNGGYFAEVGPDWSIIDERKSFNAEIDTCSAYLIYYYLAVKDPAILKDLTQIADTAVNYMINPDTGFVGESFSGGWKSIDPWLWVGHNLKTAWVLMRTYWLTGDRKYSDAADKIAEAQIKYNWDNKNFGWLFQFRENNPESVRDVKDWWTQCEGDFIMLNLYRFSTNQNYLQYFEENAYFWDKFLIDHKYGDCYPNTLRNGRPNEVYKGNLYKSAYHTMEHALYNYLYLNLYVNHRDAELFFSLSSDHENEKHFVIPVEGPGVVIKKVEINGKDWDKFNAKEGFILMPVGTGIKVKVTIGS